LKIIKIVRHIKSSIRFIWYHPLVKGRRFRAVFRYIYFHFISRLKKIDKKIDFVEYTSLLVRRDLSGAVTNYFTYLADYEEMMFLLHFLRQGDIFYDIGSNVGSYSILASGVIGCNTVAFEPVKETFEHLLENIKLNGISDKVSVFNIALGENEAEVNISNSSGALNRIKNEKHLNTEIVKQKSLDSIIKNNIPRLIKIDVEGYEMKVLLGARRILSNLKLKAIIIELNGGSKKYDMTDNQIHNMIVSFGFHAISYDPMSRKLYPLMNYNNQSHNTIYIRNIDDVANLVSESRKYKVGMTMI